MSSIRRTALWSLTALCIASAAVARPPLPGDKRPPVPAQPQPRPAAPAPGPPAAPAAQVSIAEVQILLDRVNISPGVIDGKGGDNTRKALAAFQEAHDLPATGDVDAVTIENLRAAGGGPILVPYTVTAQDVAGPFFQIPEDMEQKAKLPALGYSSPLEMLAERFHATPELLQELNPQARFVPGDALRVPSVRAVPAEGRPASNHVRVVVSKAQSTLVVDNGDDLLFFAPVTSGSEHDPLPLGEWKVKGVARNPIFNYDPDLFWNADPSHAKAKLAPGPNNPVGVVWIDISKEHYGIHGTPEPQLIGKTTSHGCVRMTNWDALTLAALVKPGTPVFFQP
jgi:lipoprotein-anchoring transpeptidase ErfK/SrfK